MRLILISKKDYNILSSEKQAHKEGQLRGGLDKLQ